MRLARAANNRQKGRGRRLVTLPRSARRRRQDGAEGTLQSRCDGAPRWRWAHSRCQPAWPQRGRCKSGRPWPARLGAVPREPRPGGARTSWPRPADGRRPCPCGVNRRGCIPTWPVAHSSSQSTHHNQYNNKQGQHHHRQRATISTTIAITIVHMPRARLLNRLRRGSKVGCQVKRCIVHCYA